VYNRQRPQAKGHAANADYTPFTELKAMCNVDIGENSTQRGIPALFRRGFPAKLIQCDAESIGEFDSRRYFAFTAALYILDGSYGRAG